MLVIQNVLIEEAVVEEQFMCNLNACKGACCWEGEYGAPLEKEELQTLENIYEDIKPFLTGEGIKTLEQEGLYQYNNEVKSFETTLIGGGPCAYMIRDQRGIAKCGIETAYRAGATDFIKPVSCHLYPIRCSENEQNNFISLEYHEWDICSAACQLGKERKMPVYQFVKEGIIRKFGEDFFQELDQMSLHLKNKC